MLRRSNLADAQSFFNCKHSRMLLYVPVAPNSTVALGSLNLTLPVGQSTSNESMRAIVTTAFEECWPATGRVVFLGRWCLRESRRDAWERFDYEILPYHWGGVGAVESDAAALRLLYEQLLPQLADQLNAIHGTRWSNRYWRIFAGCWLTYVVQVLYDRWKTVQLAASTCPDGTILAPVGFAEPRVEDSMALFQRSTESDEWNAMMFAVIASECTSLPVQEVASPLPTLGKDVAAGSRAQSVLAKRHAFKASIRQTLSHAIPSISDRGMALVVRPSRNQRIAMQTTYLARSASRELDRIVQQRIQIDYHARPKPTGVSLGMREWTLPGLGDDFSSLVGRMIPRLLPTCFLEGYTALVQQSHAVPWPRSPKIVLTATAYDSDVVWCEWAARMVENGSELVLLQHGGNYGIGKWSSFHEHELAIADRFLSWGWRDPENNQIVPAPASKLIGLKPRAKKAQRPDCLLVTGAMPRYSYWLYCASFGPFMEEYFEDQFTFVSGLSAEVISALRVRLYQNDYGWDQVVRWQTRFPGIQLDEGRTPIRRLEDSARIFVATYNATAFLESFVRGIPTIIYWDPTHWLLSERGEIALKNLERVGIFFSDPIAAAGRVNELWYSAEDWWNTREIQNVVRDFCNEFAYVGPNPVHELADILIAPTVQQ